MKLNKIKTVRNAILVGTALALTSLQSFAAVVAIDTAGISEQVNSGATSAGVIAGYVAAALAVLACAGVIFGMLRKS